MPSRDESGISGSGPTLDHLEKGSAACSHRGVGFSGEVRASLPNGVGIRSGVNVHFRAGGPEMTPRERRDEMWVSPD